MTPTHTNRPLHSAATRPSAFSIAATVSMLLLGIASLTGCAGISAGAGSNQQQQPGSLSLGSAGVNFGSITAGTTKTLSLTATNLGSQSVTISSANTSNNSFTLMSPSVPSTVAAGASTTFSLKFAPGAAGTFSGTLTIASNASDASVSVPLSGTAVANGQLAANPSITAFGNVLVGNQQTISETLTNTGVSSVTISQASASGSGFSLSGLTTPLTLSGGQSTSFTIGFSPQSTGAASGNVTITSDATNPTLTIPLSGTGIAAGQLTANPATAAFGNITLGNQLSISETVTNTGGTSVSISQAAISGTGFTLSGIAAPVTLAAGQSTSFSVVFAPPSSGAASGNVTLTSNASNPTLTIPLTGSGITPGQLTNNPASAAFGNVNVGSQQSLTETVTNTGGTSVTISQVGITGTGFSLSGITPPKTLTAGQSTTLTVTFAPQAAGAASGTVTVTSNAPNPTLTIPLSGTGTSVQSAQLSVSPATLALGSVTVGSSGNGSGTLTASGGSVTVTAASTNNSAFTVGGLSLPVTIASGQSVPFTITFSPQATGSASATLTVTSNAQPSTTTEALTGTGTAAATHSVNLSWTASTSSDVAGYNIYRAPYGGSCGAFSKINSVLNTSTVYTDSTVANSTSYCYATTAVDTSNDESSYSNIVSNIAIP